MLKNQRDCLRLLEELRWHGVPTCPYCGSTRAAAIKREQRYHCNNCFTSYSVTVGTLFHKTRVDLTKWLRAIQLVLDKDRSISVRRLAREIEVNKNTAKYMIDRIRASELKREELLIRIAESLQALKRHESNLNH